MNLSCNIKLPTKLKNSFLIIDTCAIIDATKADDFRNLLFTIKKSGCIFISATPVKQELIYKINHEHFSQKVDQISPK